MNDLLMHRRQETRPIEKPLRPTPTITLQEGYRDLRRVIGDCRTFSLTETMTSETSFEARANSRWIRKT
jgi:hypothetical protein